MTFATLAILASLASPTPQTAPGRTPIATPAAAQATEPAVGATVVDTAGAQVGTIETLTNGTAVINTGTNKVGYPVTSMTPGPNGVIIAMTKAQLDASYAEQVAKAKADLQSKLVAGTPVRSRNGAAQVGVIKAADPEFVTVTTTAKGDVRLPANGFSLDAQGGVIIGLTVDEFNAAIGAK